MTRIFAAAAAAFIAMHASPASADGALAVGTTADPANDGIAFGYMTAASEDEARKVALSNCRAVKVSKAATQLCRVIGTFKNECFAVALDPKEGTAGAGWSFGPSKRVAEMRALESCKVTAGADRRDYCALSEAACDGSAK